MALFTDSDFISSADLQVIDQEITKVATTENITLSATIGQATQEVGQHILSRIQSSGSTLLQGGEVSWNHLAAVYDGSITSGNYPRVQLGQIVVTSPRPGYLSAVKTVGLYYALMIFYRNAANRLTKQVDRYQEKRDGFRDDLRNTYWPMLIAQGLPVVFQPLPCPAAAHEPDTGSWTETAGGSGSTAAAGDYDVALTWVGAPYVSPIKNGNGQSAPSATKTVTLASGQYIQIDITGLNPPSAMTNNPVPVAYSGYNPIMAATGWNVWAGAHGAILKLVNANPIAIGTKTYQADPAVTTAYTISSGQFPDIQLPMVQTIMRA